MAAIPEVNYLRALTDPARIAELCDLARGECKSHATGIAEWHQRHGELQAIFDSFDSLQTRLVPVQEALEELAQRSSKPCELAQNVSGPVRKLDTTKQRVDNTARKIEDIIDLKNCMGSVVGALEKGKYEEAAGNIRRYLLLDESVLDSHSRELLKQRQLEMKNLVEIKLEEATRTNNEPSVRRFCRLLGQLGAEDDSLKRYASFVRHQCSKTTNEIRLKLEANLSRTTEELIKKKEGIVTCADALTRICEEIAAVSHRQVGPTADDPLWQGSAPAVLRELQTQCDTDGCWVLDSFYKKHSLLSRIAEVQARRGVEVRSDPRELPRLLEEMAILSQTAEVFDSFIRSKEKEALSLIEKSRSESESTSDVPTKPPRPVEGLAQCSDLNRRSQETISHYILLEEYYMAESTRNILRSEEHNAETIDLIFFVLQHSIERSLMTCSPSCACAAINNASTVLTRDVLEVMIKELKEAINKPVPVLAWGQQDTSLQKSIWSLINCLDQTAVNIEKLNSITASECQKLFERLPGALTKVRACLEYLMDAGKGCRASLSEYMDSACRQYVLPRMRAALDSAATVRFSYELTQTEFESIDSSESPYAALSTSTESLCKQFEGTLTTGAYEALVGRMIGSVADKVEQVILQRRFNQLGAMQLERDLRFLTTQLGKLAGRASRDKLARLSQIALFLSVDRAAEAAELWKESGGRVTWRLAPAEVRRFLALRVEFTPEQVGAIKLG